jgi:hypothetical protein
MGSNLVISFLHKELFFPLKLELFTFQICNFLKVDIFKNKIKIVWVLLKFYLPQNEPLCLFNETDSLVVNVKILPIPKKGTE